MCRRWQEAGLNLNASHHPKDPVHGHFCPLEFKMKGFIKGLKAPNCGYAHTPKLARRLQSQDHPSIPNLLSTHRYSPTPGGKMTSTKSGSHVDSCLLRMYREGTALHETRHPPYTPSAVCDIL